jgi:hypothetical protein
MNLHNFRVVLVVSFVGITTVLHVTNSTIQWLKTTVCGWRISVDA